MKNNKVYIVGGDTSYLHVFDVPLEQVDSIEEADFAIFTGGADVNPTLYGEEPHPTTHVNYPRDMAERVEFQNILEAGLPMVMICRGAQFGTVMAGGKLVQNVRGQSFLHPVVDMDTKEEFIVTSTHHQLMHPFLMDKEDYKVLAYSENTIKIWEGLPKGEEIPDIECEIVYYPKINALCIQGHPEYSNAPDHFKRVSRFYFENNCIKPKIKLIEDTMKRYRKSLKEIKLSSSEGMWREFSEKFESKAKDIEF